MYFKRTTQAAQRCKNEQERCSRGRETRVGRRYNVSRPEANEAPRGEAALRDVGRDALRALVDRVGRVNIATCAEAAVALATPGMSAATRAGAWRAASLELGRRAVASGLDSPKACEALLDVCKAVAEAARRDSFGDPSEKDAPAASPWIALRENGSLDSNRPPRESRPRPLLESFSDESRPRSLLE